MKGLQQVQDVLERILPAKKVSFHNSFWRGKTRDELVATTIFDVPLFVPGKVDESYIALALRGMVKDHPIMNLFYGIKPADKDIAVIEEWIKNNCPESPSVNEGSLVTSSVVAAATDETHNIYWRDIDDFFLPGLASPTTLPHVLRIHTKSLNAWADTKVKGNAASWPNFMAKADVQQSFMYIRLHQRRLIRAYYGESQSDLFESLWKFGGCLLPDDPQSHSGHLRHTMNGPIDWFQWVGYIEMSLLANDREEVDVNLARGWQLGIIADGLLRKDSERRQGERIPITDFNESPDLFTQVVTRYRQADIQTLTADMVRRAIETRDAGVIQL